MAVELMEHWTIEPPADILIAQYLGYKPPQKLKGDMQDFVRALPAGKGRTKSMDRAPEYLQRAAAKMKEELARKANA